MRLLLIFLCRSGQTEAQNDIFLLTCSVRRGMLEPVESPAKGVWEKSEISLKSTGQDPWGARTLCADPLYRVNIEGQKQSRCIT